MKHQEAILSNNSNLYRKCLKSVKVDHLFDLELSHCLLTLRYLYNLSKRRTALPSTQV